MTTSPYQSVAAHLPTLRRTEWLARVAPLVGVAVLVGGLGIAQGGYFPVSWGWTALLVLFLLFVCLLAGLKAALSTGQAVFLVSLTLLTAWIALSIAWSTDASASVDELERMLVYLAVGLAAVFILRRNDVHRVVGGLLLGVGGVATYSLATRLFPDRLGSSDPFAVNRLSDPVGYWNVLGLIVAMAIVLALGVCAHARRVWVRLLAGAVLPILVTTLYFTFGRGAWLALFAALVAVVVVSPTRLKFIAVSLVVALVPALAVWLASRSKPLTEKYVSLSSETHDGHRFALILLLLVVVSAAVAGAVMIAERRLTFPRGIQRAFGTGLAVLAAAAVVAVVAVAGGPSALVHKAYRQFKAPPSNGQALTGRLFALSNNGRIDYWHVAWREYSDHPALGGGAGSYEEYWFKYRRSGDVVSDAHNIYLETLAELGPVGLGLLALVLALPLAALRRARRHPYVPVLAGAYTAFLVHGIFDWDWEMPVATVAALLIGAAILVAARRPAAGSRLVGGRASAVLAVALLAPMAFATMTLVGNIAISSASSAVADGHSKSAADDARRARFWSPWSPRPLELLAQAEVGLSDLPAARMDLRAAIAKDPRDWRLWNELSVYTKGPARANARRRARALDPIDFPEAGP